MELGDKLKVVNILPLKNNSIAPDLDVLKEYECKEIFVCKCGEEHIDVGLELNLNYVECYKCRETLPKTTHFCHSSRFIVKE